MNIKGKSNNNGLQGRNNKRIDKCEPTNCENTAAWQDCDEHYKVDLVNKPSLDKIIDAKDWVDNGSKL